MAVDLIITILTNFHAFQINKQKQKPFQKVYRPYYFPHQPPSGRIRVQSKIKNKVKTLKIKKWAKNWDNTFVLG